jgi:magnesium transporter
MNFRHLPEFEWTNGYPVVLVVITLICIGLYQGFRPQRLAVAGRRSAR